MQQQEDSEERRELAHILFLVSCGLMPLSQVQRDFRKEAPGYQVRRRQLGTTTRFLILDPSGTVFDYFDFEPIDPAGVDTSNHQS